MSDDNTYEIPLQDQRVFGAGIKRKRVKFVPSTQDSTTAPSSSRTAAQSVSDLYLKLVLPGEHATGEVSQFVSPNLGQPNRAFAAEEASEKAAEGLCEICNLPLTSDSMSTFSGGTMSPNESTQDTQALKIRPHEASLAHQICLAHSHPPSHLDRSRKGLSYLSNYGWDPDSRLGLGAQGQGIQFPIKTKPKNDKMGIGVVLPKEGDRRKKEKVEKLDAGKIRKMHDIDKRKAEKLRETFYRNEDVERYLGGG